MIKATYLRGKCIYTFKCYNCPFPGSDCHKAVWVSLENNYEWHLSPLLVSWDQCLFRTLFTELLFKTFFWKFSRVSPLAPRLMCRLFSGLTGKRERILKIIWSLDGQINEKQRNTKTFPVIKIRTIASAWAFCSFRVNIFVSYLISILYIVIFLLDAYIQHIKLTIQLRR